MPKKKTNKRPDKRPARARYWNERKLEKHKVRNLMRHNGFASKAEALKFWKSVRTKRMR